MNAVVYAMFVAGWLGVQAEVFACPMHPEVQSSMPGTCLRCGMPLLRRSVDPAAPEYVMEIQPRWSSPGSSARLHFRFRTGTGLAAEEFQTVHERELHAFIVSRDLRFFEHAHPTRSNRGEFSLLVTFPALGEYMVFADFVPNGALPQMLQQLVVTPGFRGRMERHGFTAGLDDQIADGLRFALKIEEFKAGTPSLLTFIVTDAATGAPVKDLEPYLGATGHLFFANADFVDAAHSHPLETGPGPTIRFLTRFNAAGLYRAWLQVQRLGRVVTVAWTLDVPEPQR